MYNEEAEAQGALRGNEEHRRGHLSHSDEEGADLIVCGSRGTGGIRFSSKGSVCEYIMRNSPIPTVIIPHLKSHF